MHSHLSRRHFVTLVAAASFLVGGTVFGAPLPTVKLSTSMGEIEIELDPVHAPKTVANFLQYVKAGQYKGTVFHRVIPGFMIQGGGMTTDMSEKPTRAPIVLESRNGLSNLRGTVAMARTGEPNSATAQFFINVVDNLRLDGSGEGTGYAVFGRVIAGMEIVDRIREVPTADRGEHQNVPIKPVLINSATLKP